MPDICVSDTGPILHLLEIGAVRHVECFDVIIISSQVRTELQRHAALQAAATSLTDRVRAQRVSSSEIEAQRLRLRGFRLHTADLSTAALAERLRPDVVLTDDLRLRKALESLSHKVVGSIGILVRAFGSGSVSKAELESSLDALLDGSSLYTSKAFRARIGEMLKSL